MSEIIEEEIGGSHTDDDRQESPETLTESDVKDVFEAFGLTKETKPDEEDEKEAPAIEKPKSEPKKVTFKFDKEDREVEVTDDNLPEYLQKATAFDRQKERTQEYERDLDRAAKLAGFKDHAELRANLDKMEQNQVKAKEDAFHNARQKVIDDLVYNGVSEEAAIEFAENNPLVQQARQAMEERQQLESERQQQSVKQKVQSEWNQLYEAFPDIRDSSQAFTKGESPEWYTTEMKAMVEQGYKPLDAYRLAHMDKIQSQTKKATEQRIIKEQRLGLRSRVETNTTPDTEPQVSAELASAFEAFGLPATAAKKYAKK